MKYSTWKLLERKEATSRGKKVIGCRWVFTLKPIVDDDGIVRRHRHKARLVIKGYQQVEGVDFDQTFAPVSRQQTFRMLIACAAGQDWEIDQMDVVTAFLNGTLEDSEVYMEQPEGYETKDKDMICHLLKALYGLKQAPRI